MTTGGQVLKQGRDKGSSFLFSLVGACSSKLFVLSSWKTGFWLLLLSAIEALFLHVGA
jgi:hypothetical protein